MPTEPATRNREDIFIRRAGRNFLKLLGGRGVAAILELLTIGILARYLSPDPFGKIVLMQTYVMVIRGLLNFRLYEVLVKFGVPLIEANDTTSFRGLLRLTFFIDLTSSLLATIIAITAATLTSQLFGWDSLVADISMFYSLVLLTYGFGTAKGVLRMFDRYDMLGYQLMIGPVLRFLGVTLVAILEPDIYSFVITLTIATALGNLSLIVMGLVELRRQLGELPFTALPQKSWQSDFHGIRQFIVILYWQGNVDIMPRHLSTLLAGSMLGPAGAGLLRIARETTKILSKPGALLRQVLFPDLVRLWLEGTEIFAPIVSRAVIVSTLLGAIFVLASVFAGPTLLAAALGDDYRLAAPLITWLLLATTIELIGSVLRVAGYAIGHASEILRLHLLSSVIYLLLFVLLTPPLGLVGPGLAACLAAAVPLAGMGHLVIKAVRVRAMEPGSSAIRPANLNDNAPRANGG